MGNTKNKNTISIKVHESYRKIIAICDAELIGKRFEDGNLQLDINKHFYQGQEMKEEEIKNFLMLLEKDSPNAGFNIVGKRAVDLLLQIKYIKKEGIKKIAGVPYAMIF